MCGTSDASLANLIAQAESLLDQFAALEVGPLPVSEVGSGIEGLRKLQNRLAAQMVRLVAVFDKAGGAKRAGATSTQGWLGAQLNLDRSAARRTTELAQSVQIVPTTTDALGAGAVSVEHAAVIASTVAELGPDQAAAVKAEAKLLAAARRTTPSELARLAQHLRHQADPQTLADELLSQLDERELHIGQDPRTGMVLIKGRLDRESGEIVQSALMPLTKPRGSGDGQQDPRSAGQRAADALVALAQRALD